MTRKYLSNTTNIEMDVIYLLYIHILPPISKWQHYWYDISLRISLKFNFMIISTLVWVIRPFYGYLQHFVWFQNKQHCGDESATNFVVACRVFIHLHIHDSFLLLIKYMSFIHWYSGWIYSSFDSRTKRSHFKSKWLTHFLNELSLFNSIFHT